MDARLLFGSIVLTGISGCTGQKPANEGDFPLKPNIIYILADDLGYGDLSLYGQEKFSTPNIDSLGTGGMKFTQHYAGSTVCAPSRSALMTGLHTGHTPVRGNMEIQPEGQWPLPDESLTLAELLKQAGYVTGAFGKWGLGYPGSEGDPNNQGFDVFFGYNCQRKAHNYYPYYLWDNQEKVMLDDNAGTLTGTYAPELIQERALQFMRDNRDTTFFLYYPTVIPHAELFAPEAYMAMFRDRLLPEKEYTGVDSGEKFRDGAYGSQPEAHAAFAAMVTLLDDQVGALMAELRKLGIEHNTVVVFTSDNGPHVEGGADPDYFDSNGPYKGYKRDLYEGGIRVPLLVHWPGVIQAGSESDHVSAFWDVMPTCAEMAGISPPAGIDGISFLPALLGREQPQHEYLYWEFHELGGRVALRQDNWKAIRYNVNAIPEGVLELYDLSADPGEETDLAGQYPEVAARMEMLMDSAHVASEMFPFREEKASQEEALQEEASPEGALQEESTAM